MSGKQYYTYIMASKRNGTLYIGVTGDLEQRIFEHKNNLIEGFTKRYGVHTLVHYETYDNPDNAIHREKDLKEWRRPWKLKLIEDNNPEWEDLAKDWYDGKERVPGSDFTENNAS